MKEIPFLSLAMDLPPPPLYLDERLQNIIPQVPLGQLFMKFNGQTEKVSNILDVLGVLLKSFFQEYKTYNENFIKRFELIHLPEYLIITYNRFQKNQWFVEKNPTIVNFPIRFYKFFRFKEHEVVLWKKWLSIFFLSQLLLAFFLKYFLHL